MPDAYNPWGAPVFPTADDNAMQPETFVPQGVQDWTRQAAPKDYNILSQIAGSLGKALMYPGQVAQSQTPISTEDMVGPAFNLAGMLTLGAGAAPQEANALNMGIKAYHSTYQPFENYDFSRLGQVTRANTDSEWAHNLAQVGPWASDRALTGEMGASHVLPVDIGGQGKSFGSLDDLEAAIREHGGPQQFRQKLIDDGFGHIKVKDTEFGGDSYVGLSPDNFTVLKPPFPEANSATAGIGPAPGIRAYHGSPHDFDKFDLSKIGTGEGAQAYGQGLYFADSEGVAKSYRDGLSAPLNKPANRLVVDGQKLADNPEFQALPLPVQRSVNSAMSLGATKDQALKNVLYQRAQAVKGVEENANNPNLAKLYRPEYHDQAHEFISKLPDNIVDTGHNPGHMYEVNINADPSHFLDWDKPLSQQPEHVTQALQTILKDRERMPADWVKSSPGAESRLNEAGIPGIKYLDQGSRGAGQGSSNYVVFNHDLIDIMRKYAVPGMLGAPILANALSEQKT